jgi:molybdenum cofactor cytidylyltransferase
MKLTLAQALRIGPSPCIAFIGAGGKTTAMFQLARQLTQPVIVTATSHLGIWQKEWADKHIIAKTSAPLEELEHGLNGVLLVTSEIEGDRVKPIDSELLKWLKEFCSYHSIPLLIEADGSRRKPLKAWAEHEPPIPAFVDMVVQVVGLTGLGKPLNAETVHRHEIFSQLGGQAIGDSVTDEALVRILTHPEGGLKNIPIQARRTVLLNQADTLELQSAAQGLAKALMPVYSPVIISSLEQEKIFAVHEPVAGIVLAAGESSRFGQPKQLLDWKGQPFVRAVAQTAIEAGLSPVVIVTGANAPLIELAVKDLNVTVVHNEEWKSGQGSSIRTGIKHLTEDRKIGSAIFLLTDQPQVSASVLRALAEKHAQGLYSVVAPMVMDQRANPVLFDRLTFPDLLLLEGDVGGRAIFHKHRVEYLPWHDDRLLLDVDTPEMYQRLISDETL